MSKQRHIGDVGFALEIDGWLHPVSICGDVRQRLLRLAYERKPLPHGLVLAATPWASLTVAIGWDDVRWEGLRK